MYEQIRFEYVTSGREYTGLNPQRQHCNSLEISGYRISSNNTAGGDYFSFAQKGGDYSREAIISNVGQWKSCPKYIFFVFTLNKKIITSNKLNMGFLSVPNLVP